MKKILIVDDDNFNVEILIEWLSDATELKYSFYIANSGEEAIDKYIAIRPNVVLLDVMLEDTSGFYVCKKMREFNSIKSKIILMSGRSMQEDIEEGMRSGADHYITKPFDFDEMIKLL